MPVIKAARMFQGGRSTPAPYQGAPAGPARRSSPAPRRRTTSAPEVGALGGRCPQAPVICPPRANKMRVLFNFEKLQEGMAAGSAPAAPSGAPLPPAPIARRSAASSPVPLCTARRAWRGRAVSPLAALRFPCSPPLFKKEQNEHFVQFPLPMRSAQGAGELRRAGLVLPPLRSRVLFVVRI